MTFSDENFDFYLEKEIQHCACVNKNIFVCLFSRFVSTSRKQSMESVVIFVNMPDFVYKVLENRVCGLVSLLLMNHLDYI